MGDLISRSGAAGILRAKADTAVCTDWHVLYLNAARIIEKLPAVDAVEVVRCRDCKHTTRSKVSPEKIICCLTKMCGTVDPDFFCADGEREIDAEVEG